MVNWLRPSKAYTGEGSGYFNFTAENGCIDDPLLLLGGEGYGTLPAVEHFVPRGTQCWCLRGHVHVIWHCKQPDINPTPSQDATMHMITQQCARPFPPNLM